MRYFIIYFLLVNLVVIGDMYILNARTIEGCDTLSSGDYFDFSNPDTLIDMDICFTKTTYPNEYQMLQSSYLGGIMDLGEASIDSIGTVLGNDFQITIERPEETNVYCVKTVDGKYALIQIYNITMPLYIIEMRWIYQDDGSKVFNGQSGISNTFHSIGWHDLKSFFLK